MIPFSRWSTSRLLTTTGGWAFLVLLASLLMRPPEFLWASGPSGTLGGFIGELWTTTELVVAFGPPLLLILWRAAYPPRS